MDSDSDYDEDLDRFRRYQRGIQGFSELGSDSEEEPPRRRLRLDPAESPSPEVLVLRDCRVRVPRIPTVADLSHPIPSSSSNITSRITTRAATAAAAAAVATSSSTPTSSSRRQNDMSGASESDLSLSPIRAGDIAFQHSFSSDADSEFARNWLQRRLIRRNAIFRDDEEVDDESDDDDAESDLIDLLFDEDDDTNDANRVLDDNTNDNSSNSSEEGSITTVDILASTTTNNVQINNAPTPGPSNRLLDDTTKSGDDDEGLTCLICYEPFTNSGEHRLTCLRCGHTYGKACIEKWIKNEKRCPQCNAKAVKKDIRILYVKNLKALDTIERDKLLVDLEKEKDSKRKLELECARLRQMNQCRDSDFVKLNNELRLLRDKIGGIYRNPLSSNSGEAISSTVNSSKGFVQAKFLEFRDGEFRVGDYNRWLSMTAISQTLRNPLYPNGCYGIKRINMLDLKAMQTNPIHHKEIRDIQFNKLQNDLLLSVGMDKKALLTNCQNNVIVQTFNTHNPLWSCTWNSMCEHIFYVGTSNGQIITYDLRNPQDYIKVLTIPTEDKSPIARMHYITPSYQNTTFTLSGLIIQKLNSCWFCEIKNEKEIFHQLPVEGSFSSIDFETKSRHLLISTRPNLIKSPGGRHLVCELNQYYSDAQDCNICSCNIIQTFEGGPTGLAKMSRSSIFSPVDGTVLVGANSGQNMVNLWNLSDVNMKQTIQTRDGILDFVPCQVNDNFLLNMITSNGVHVYKHNN